MSGLKVLFGRSEGKKTDCRLLIRRKSKPAANFHREECFHMGEINIGCASNNFTHGDFHYCESVDIHESSLAMTKVTRPFAKLMTSFPVAMFSGERIADLKTSAFG